MNGYVFHRSGIREMRASCGQLSYEMLMCSVVTWHAAFVLHTGRYHGENRQQEQNQPVTRWNVAIQRIGWERSRYRCVMGRW